jgi:hypothetical protein
MSQWSIDPELAQRRLRTLVRLLRTEARGHALRGRTQIVHSGELDFKEMTDWANQCENLLTGPTPRKAKPIEQMSDEELLS